MPSSKPVAQRRHIDRLSLESHVVYRRELKAGDCVRYEIQLLDLSESFVHYIDKMYHGEAGHFAASSEFTRLAPSSICRPVA